LAGPQKCKTLFYKNINNLDPHVNYKIMPCRIAAMAMIVAEAARMSYNISSVTSVGYMDNAFVYSLNVYAWV